MKKKAIHEGTSGTTIYKCGFQGCTHFVYEPLIIGRESVCWHCGEIFEIVRKTIRNKKLHCEDCTRGRKKALISIDELEKLMKGTM